MELWNLHRVMYPINHALQIVQHEAMYHVNIIDIGYKLLETSLWYHISDHIIKKLVWWSFVVKLNWCHYLDLIPVCNLLWLMDNFLFTTVVLVLDPAGRVQSWENSWHHPTSGLKNLSTWIQLGLGWEKGKPWIHIWGAFLLIWHLNMEFSDWV